MCVRETQRERERKREKEEREESDLVITTILPTTPTVTVKMMPQRVTQIE
jgi:hypothetical protein